MCMHKLTYDMSGYQSSHLQHIPPGVSDVCVPLLEGDGATGTGTTCDMVVSISPYNRPCTHLHVMISAGQLVTTAQEINTYVHVQSDWLTNELIDHLYTVLFFFLQETCSSEVNSYTQCKK